MKLVTLRAEFITRISVLPVTYNTGTSEECLLRDHMGFNGRHNTPVYLPPGKSPSTHSTGRWVGDRADLGAVMEKMKSLASTEIRTLTVQTVASRSSDRTGMVY